MYKDVVCNNSIKEVGKELYKSRVCATEVKLIAIKIRLL